MRKGVRSSATSSPFCGRSIRIDAVRATLPAYRRQPWAKLCGPHRLLEVGTRPWVEYCVGHVRDVAERTGADIDGSDRGMENLKQAWRIENSET